MYDVIIIGAGPAGLSAAIYTARANLKTLLVGITANSNAFKAHIFENYMGFEKQISGSFLMEESKKQAVKFGTEFVPREVVDIKQNADATFTVTDTERAVYQSKAVIICSGLGFKPSGIKNEQPLIGRGVSFCVTCDGPFFKNKNVAVIGNAHFAGEEALQLLTYTPHVTILSHGRDFAFSEKMMEGIAKNSIKLVNTPRISEFFGTEKFEKMKCADASEHIFDGVFLALGIATAADFANQLGIARTGPQNAFLVADPRTGETNVKGIYAAGDCTGGNAQAAKSSGEGCNAAISVIKLLKGVAAYVDYS
jgi:thioredoxin reductase (NADPH)